ncbi:hypothetical protein SAMN05216370_0124 [Pseudomonas peli]|uniref:Uncharacterized protein n=1 Tax=Pseudomonas peli TaxID=592361 RepID=A0AB37ZDD4_9PSED|nr:hypothetical protein [Pseudomonas peli]NMZ71359.1 hypothetical protein [Pseudomonas peli]SCW90280.1 hypothetical protein SAMN05216370_0124 [Pseudomonas peli]
MEKENGLDEAARASTVEAWVFWLLVSRWALAVTAVLYWLGVVGFSPLDLIEWVGRALYGTSETAAEDLPKYIAGPYAFIHGLFGGASWLFLFLPLRAFVRYRVGVIEAGSEEAYRQRIREEAERASTPQPVGVLVSISIAKGGALSSSETLVETADGFFRVSGLVDTVKKGEPVFVLGNSLLIGEGDRQRRYTVIS